MKKTLLLIVILISFSSYAQDFSTYEKRKAWIIKEVSTDANYLRETGKLGNPTALVHLTVNPKDKVAANYLVQVFSDTKKQTMFDFSGICFALCKFRNSFDKEQLEVLKKSFERLAKTDKIEEEGFLGHGTENHFLMNCCGEYFAGQCFPDAKFVNGWNSEKIMSDAKQRLREVFKRYYMMGYTEYLSPTYDGCSQNAVAVLYLYAKDKEVREMAEAWLLYKYSIQSLNYFNGHILAPYGRQNVQQTNKPLVAGKIGVFQLIDWLYWGWGSNSNAIPKGEFVKAFDVQFATFQALLDITPGDVFNRIAGEKLPPFEIKSSASTFINQGSYHLNGGIPNMMLRKVYRDKQYAIGTGNFRWVPGGDYADHDAVSFNIVWNSSDQFNFIECYHPYWCSDEGMDEKTGKVHPRSPDKWDQGSISPFQQTAQNENTAIVFFNIPDKDPWPNKPSADKWAWRDGHADNLIKRGMFRYPKSMDEKIEENGWLFLREGDVYVGVKSLKDYYIQTDLKNEDMLGFNVVKSDFAKCGFIFEVGAKAEYNSLNSFKEKIQKNPLKVDWSGMTVEYTNLKGKTLKLIYNEGLKVDPDGLANSVPKVIINGKQEMDVKEWPLLSSPFINLSNSILEIKQGNTYIKVDWSGELPRITKQL